MSVIDHSPIALPGAHKTDPEPGQHPLPRVADRTAEVPVAPMDGSSDATRMIRETGTDTRSWIAVEYLA
ncbi:hypothetical protein ABGB16_16125 [Micromonospora sp. B11E3]|uniref:hypothetical protein n=1 Tax=Micromonospora sp. B11E3 TaxID=3153562 RepID=UPI00325E47FA